MLTAEKLLTVKDVAKYLQISESAVYDRKRELRGFYPFGIGVLRFKPEVIYGDLEGQDKKGLALRLPVLGGALRRGRIKDTPGGYGYKGITPGANKGAIKTDPARHGL